MPLPFHRRRLDPDAADFCRRSGATDRAAINAFVRGVKDLGLWDKMVCWPLRSAQNAGSGNTVYSLGGLGTYNGTLVGTPTIGSSGITVTATKYITDGYGAPLVPASIVVAGRRVAGTGSAAWQYVSSGSSRSLAKRMYANNSAGLGIAAVGYIMQVDTDAQTLSDDFEVVTGIVPTSTNSEAEVYINTTKPAQTAGATSWGASASTGATLSATGDGQFEASMHAVFSTAIDATAFYTLYRNTLGTGLGLPDYDPATIEFASRSGATDLANIDAFVRGVKDLGLWDSMVCWPLRSAQNAGTGTTAYSLGGLGTYDGTLVNTPAWGADGIDFVAASSTHITTTLDVAGLRKFTTMVATDPGAYTSLDAMIGAWGTTNYLAVRRNGATAIDFIVSSSGTKAATAVGQSEDWRVYGWGTQGLNTVGTAGGTQIATQAFVPDQTGSQALNIGILATPNNSPYNGKIAWAFFYKDNELTTAQQLSVYNLYKTTLGTGLGLP